MMMQNLHSMHAMHLSSGLKTLQKDVGIVSGIRQGTSVGKHPHASRSRDARPCTHAQTTQSAPLALASPARRGEQRVANASDQVTASMHCEM